MVLLQERHNLHPARLGGPGQASLLAAKGLEELLQALTAHNSPNKQQPAGDPRPHWSYRSA